MTTDVEIVRRPIDEDTYYQHTSKPKFPRMPILYLEFLENPSKVKPEMIGKDYVPIREESDIEEDGPNDELNVPLKSDSEEEEDEDDRFARERRSYKHRSRDEDDRLKRHNSDSEGKTRTRTRSRTRSERMDKEEGQDETKKEVEEVTSSPQRPTPPTLAELRARNQTKTLKPSDYKYPQEEEDEVTQKRNDVFFHYEVLKRMHPNATIPEFTAYSDPEVMAQKYELLAKKLSLDSSVENWKRYMIIFVMGCEVGLGKLNFDMEGFAQQQIASMNTYDQLLVEMAEKSYVPSGNRWPVEVRLLMMLTMNIVLFVVSKMIFKRTGTNLLGTINEMTGVNGSITQPKMRDP